MSCRAEVQLKPYPRCEYNIKRRAMPKTKTRYLIRFGAANANGRTYVRGSFGEAPKLPVPCLAHMGVPENCVPSIIGAVGLDDVGLYVRDFKFMRKLAPKRQSAGINVRKDEIFEPVEEALSDKAAETVRLYKNGLVSLAASGFGIVDADMEVRGFTLASVFFTPYPANVYVNKKI